MKGINLNCETNCRFFKFYKNSREAMFITNIDGTYFDVNKSMEKLLGYSRDEFLSMKAADTYFDQSERSAYRSMIEKDGVVHNYPITLKRKDASPLPCLIDAVTWEEDGVLKGYHGIIKTRDDVMDSFQNLFMKLKNEEEKLKNERRNLANDAKLLMQYVSDDLIRHIQDTGENPLSSTKKKGTMMFFDIRNSTAIAGKLQPDVFASLLSDIFTDTMDLIYGNSGSVNKLVGDGFLATFGCPISCGADAENAVKSALQIMEYLKTFNDVRPDYLAEPIKAGIGIATGTVFSGVIGSVRRQEYTVLGDAVNIASRLESFTKNVNFNIIIDENTYRETSEICKWGKIANVMLRGKPDAFTLYGYNSLE